MNDENFACFAADVACVLRGHVLLNRDWSCPKKLQVRCESLITSMEKNKRKIWNFQLVRSDDFDGEQKQFGPSYTTEVTVSQLGQGKENFFVKRYSQLGMFFY